MRRVVAGLIVAVAVASTLLLARHASHRLVYDYIHAAELDDFYGRPPRATLAEVRDHFAEVNEHLQAELVRRPISPLYPIARVVGVIDIPAILGAGLILGIAAMIWGPGRSSRPLVAATPTFED